MRISVEADKCIASGMCVLTAPALFDQGDDGVVVVLEDEPAPAQQEAAREAAVRCPATVIRVRGTD